MIRLLYNLLWPVGLVFFLPGYLVKMFRRGNYRAHFGERFGIYSRETRDRLASGASPIWLHAVSVGEVNIALKLADALHDAEPQTRCVLTTTTTTAYPLAKRRAPDFVHVLYSPLDFWPFMRRAFAAIRPRKIVLVEQEIWPNMVAIARIRGVPVALVNARLSPRSERRFRRFRAIVGPLLRQLDVVAVPHVEDIARWQTLGVRRERIVATGSVKFDVTSPTASPDQQHDSLAKLGVTPDTPVLVGGSTHDGEEGLLARLFVQLRRELPRAFLIVAPRHVERLAAVRAVLERQSLAVALASAVRESARNCDALIIDTTGELPLWYQTATVVFIGKSFCAHGGQNPVEAVAAEKPVVFGPHMENFAALAAALVSGGGAIQVQSEDELQRAVSALMTNAASRAELIAHAQDVLSPHRGAAARTAALVHQLTQQA